MSYAVRFFARARDLAGTALVEVELPSGSTVADLRQALSQRFPALTSLIERSAIALEGEFAEENAVLPAAGEIALLPPVSGG